MAPLKPANVDDRRHVQRVVTPASGMVSQLGVGIRRLFLRCYGVKAAYILVAADMARANLANSPSWIVATKTGSCRLRLAGVNKAAKRLRAGFEPEQQPSRP